MARATLKTLCSSASNEFSLSLVFWITRSSMDTTYLLYCWLLYEAVPLKHSLTLWLSFCEQTFSKWRNIHVCVFIALDWLCSRCFIIRLLHVFQSQQGLVPVLQWHGWISQKFHSHTQKTHFYKIFVFPTRLRDKTRQHLRATSQTYCHRRKWCSILTGLKRSCIFWLCWM